MNSNGAIWNCVYSGGIFSVTLNSRMKLYLKITIFRDVLLHSLVTKLQGVIFKNFKSHED